MSAARLVPWPVHEVLEYLLGIFLIVAPFVIDELDAPVLPVLLAVGVVLVLLQLLTPGLATIAEVLPARVHATLDYLVALFLVVSPFVFGFTGTEPALLAAVFSGVGLLVLALVTRYPLPAPEAPAATGAPATTPGPGGAARTPPADDEAAGADRGTGVPSDPAPPTRGDPAGDGEPGEDGDDGGSGR